MLILNDLHIGVIRTGGTTLASQAELRIYQFESLRSLLDNSGEDHLVVAGDLFDDFEVQTRYLVQAYTVFASWLSRGKDLTLIAGNHDASSRSDRVSDFTALAQILSDRFPGKVMTLDVNAWGPIGGGVMAIAHCVSQEKFEETLEQALIFDGAHTLILHCNLNNTFAQRTDHSLDLSTEMAKKFEKKGVKILLAHEHNPRKVGNVTVLGCQFPTSIIDCIESREKFAHTLSDSGELTPIRTWNHAANAGYMEIEWNCLPESGVVYEIRGGDMCVETPGFVRVVGTAKASEASDVINAIVKFRKACAPSVFVVGNAVQIEGLMEASELPESFEASRRFDVLNYIESNLTTEEFNVVKRLIESAS